MELDLKDKKLKNDKNGAKFDNPLFYNWRYCIFIRFLMFSFLMTLIWLGKNYGSVNYIILIFIHG